HTCATLYGFSYKTPDQPPHLRHFVRFFLQNSRPTATPAPLCTIFPTKQPTDRHTCATLYGFSYKTANRPPHLRHLVRFFLQNCQPTATPAPLSTVFPTKLP